MKTHTIAYNPAQKAEIPLAWKKAAGILRKSAKKNTAELKKTRQDWEKRLRTWEKHK